MTKQPFVRSKPHLNVCIVGHSGHGKTSLCAAITVFAASQGRAEAKTREQLDSSKPERERGSSVYASYVEVETSARHVAFIDVPGDPEYVENLIGGLAGADMIILVASAVRGIEAQTREHLVLARQLSAHAPLAIFITECQGLDYEAMETVEKRLRELAKQLEFNGDDCMALRAGDPATLSEEGTNIRDLLGLVDTIPVSRPAEFPFRLDVSTVYDIRDAGVVASGLVSCGRVAVGDEVALIGGGPELRAKVAGLETFAKTMSEAQSG
ncbi:MAG: 50S ribosome-binding GTPase, partial [Myxococcales bacterium]|nr:50S ribosome-binding GTPase [Myxococcales bacterium]